MATALKNIVVVVDAVMAETGQPVEYDQRADLAIIEVDSDLRTARKLLESTLAGHFIRRLKRNDIHPGQAAKLRHDAAEYRDAGKEAVQAQIDAAIDWIASLIERRESISEQIARQKGEIPPAPYRMDDIEALLEQAKEPIDVDPEDMVTVPLDEAKEDLPASSFIGMEEPGRPEHLPDDACWSPSVGGWVFVDGGKVMATFPEDA